MTPPSAQTEWKKETRKKIYFILFDMLKPINFCNTGSIKAKHTIDKIMSIISNVQASERTRLLSVESIDKAIRNIKNLRLKHKDYGYHIHIFANENRGRCGICKMSWKESEQQSIYNQALNDACSNLRQSILSEMEKGK